MLLTVLCAAAVAVFSCLQIHLYTPFRNRLRCVLFGGFVALTAWCFECWCTATVFSPVALCLNLGLPAAACFLGLWCCKTELYCGIYNVVIQLCVNCLVLNTTYTVSGLLSVSAALRAAAQALICIGLSAVWLLIMLRLRRAVWVYMPMPDSFYSGVMVIVIIDYLLILGMCRFSPAARLALIIVCLVVLVAVLHAIRMPQYVIQERERTQMVLYQQQAMQAYIDSYMQYEDRLRTMRHDVKHMVSTVMELMEAHEYEKAEELTRHVGDWMDDAGQPEYSNNVLINAILKDYSARFSAGGVPMDVTVRLTNNIFLSDLDLTTLLHNALSNAWEYCTDPARKGKMWVRLKIITNRNYFSLECANPLEAPPLIVGKKIVSSKKDDEMLHGIGLESIRRIAAKYDGNVQIAANDGRFTLAIMLVNRPSAPPGDRTERNP